MQFVVLERKAEEDGHNECFCCAGKIALLHFHSRTSPRMMFPQTSYSETVVPLIARRDFTPSWSFSFKGRNKGRKKEIERKTSIETREFYKNEFSFDFVLCISICSCFFFVSPLVKSFLKFLFWILNFEQLDIFFSNVKLFVVSFWNVIVTFCTFLFRLVESLEFNSNNLKNRCY